jgi:hypothetical protein
MTTAPAGARGASLTARANWFLDVPEQSGPTQAAVQEVDPLDAPVLLSMLDLRTPEPRLERMMDELVKREGALYDEGIVCDLRDLPGSTCAACPLFQADPDRAPLCSVGREQEQVSATLVAKLHGR